MEKYAVVIDEGLIHDTNRVDGKNWENFLARLSTNRAYYSYVNESFNYLMILTSCLQVQFYPWK